MASTDAKPRSQEERSAESAQRLLDAAVELIAEKGFDATSATEIGQRAGYSREMVRARYGSKQALVESLWEAEYEAYLDLEPDESLNGLEQALAQVETMRSLAERDSGHMRAMFVLCCETVSSAGQPWIQRWLTAYEEALRSGLRRGREDGSVREDLDTDEVAEAVLAYIMGRGLMWTGAPDAIDFAADLGRAKERLAAIAAP